MSGDITRINEWLYATLSGDAQLTSVVGSRIYVDEAPQGAATPLVLFAFLGGADRFPTLNQSNRTTNAIYLIRGVTTGSSYVPLELPADRIDQLLRLPIQGAIVRDVFIGSVFREQPHQRKDMENGVPYVYLGGFYRIRYQPFS